MRSPGHKVVKSLGTTDYKVAELAAMPLIQEHKARLLAARPKFDLVPWISVHKLGEHTLPDGRRIFADERKVHVLNDAGEIIDTFDNGAPGYQLGGGPLSVRSLAEAHIEAFGDGTPKRRRTAEAETEDDKLFKTYLDFGGKHSNGVHGYFRREAESSWAMFKQLTGGKALARCTRDDGRLLPTHYREQGLSQASVRKKLMWLAAFFNMMVRDGKLTNANPFSGLVGKTKRTPEDRRFNLDDDDMALCRANLGTLSDKDQLLFRFLATTGARLGEAFQFEREEIKAGIRCVTIGTKSEGSLRTIPLPADLLSHLPRKITKPLFMMLEATEGKTAAERSAKAASKRLNRFLRNISIADRRKVVHSLRHRAEDQLREADCPTPIANVLLGHGKQGVDGDYGHVRFSTAKRKQWIDHIGF